MNSDFVAFDIELNLSGLSCPLPILRTKKQLSQMQSGQVLKIIATDSGSQQDFPMFAKQSGNQLLHSEITTDGEFIFFMQRK